MTLNQSMIEAIATISKCCMYQYEEGMVIDRPYL